MDDVLSPAEEVARILKAEGNHRRVLRVAPAGTEAEIRTR